MTKKSRIKTVLRTEPTTNKITSAAFDYADRAVAALERIAAAQEEILKQMAQDRARSQKLLREFQKPLQKKIGEQITEVLKHGLDEKHNDQRIT